jgi:hypothetical protein
MALKEKTGHLLVIGQEVTGYADLPAAFSPPIDEFDIAFEPGEVLIDGIISGALGLDQSFFLMVLEDPDSFL